MSEVVPRLVSGPAAGGADLVLAATNDADEIRISRAVVIGDLPPTPAGRIRGSGDRRTRHSRQDNPANYSEHVLDFADG